MPEAIPRHAIVRLLPAAWAGAIDDRPDLSGDPLLAGWVGRGWPLIGRRRLAGDLPHRAPLGLPTPPSHGKGRLAFSLPRDAIAAVEPPPTLVAVAASAPPAWLPTIKVLLEVAAHYDALPRVFGSFAWGALTGLTYVTPSSDLDLLWPMSPDVPAVLDTLAGIEAGAPGRIDGEVVGLSGEAVQWRELRDGSAEVLIKTSDGVALRDRRGFLRAEA